MRSVTYSMSMSLDGYIVGPDGSFDWPGFDEEVFRFWIDEIREVGVHLMGRRLYETMLYWETADQDPSLDDARLEWTALWKALPKVVFSRTLNEAAWANTALVKTDLLEAVRGLKRTAGADLVIMGSGTIVSQLAQAGLVDVFQVVLNPIVLGQGRTMFEGVDHRLSLKLTDTRRFTNGNVVLSYAPAYG